MLLCGRKRSSECVHAVAEGLGANAEAAAKRGAMQNEGACTGAANGGAGAAQLTANALVQAWRWQQGRVGGRESGDEKPQAAATKRKQHRWLVAKGKSC